MPIDRFAFRPVPAALALAFYAAGAAANPQGGVVKAGSATIAPNGSRLDVIQSSQRAVIDWRSFSIGAGGHVNFKQPSAASATLNRVTGPEMSAILGRLTANGTVFLVNPNGILIGPGAKIDVGGLVAATANISNENFMAGRYKFDEVVNRNAVIVNRGEITAHAGGLVALVAPGVENSGVIRAELGRVVLASGNRFTLDLFGDKLVTFAVDDKVAARLTDVDGRPLKAYVNQTGTIEADGGSILIAASAAKAVLDNVINTSGVVRATSFVQRGGEIVLHGGDEGVVRVAGVLDASDARCVGRCARRARRHRRGPRRDDRGRAPVRASTHRATPAAARSPSLRTATHVTPGTRPRAPRRGRRRLRRDLGPALARIRRHGRRRRGRRARRHAAARSDRPGHHAVARERAKLGAAPGRQCDVPGRRVDHRLRGRSTAAAVRAAAVSRSPPATASPSTATS